MGVNLFLVFAGGACGALSRYVLSLFIKRLVSSPFPVATFLINLIGSFLLGFFISLDLPSELLLLLGVGFMGSFTTFSTFQLENVTLFENRHYKTLVLYVFASIFFCVMAALVGLTISPL